MNDSAYHNGICDQVAFPTNMTLSSSHEYAETVTDPAFSDSTRVAWATPDGHEIGDLCSWEAAPFRSYYVQYLWDNTTNRCVNSSASAYTQAVEAAAPALYYKFGEAFGQTKEIDSSPNNRSGSGPTNGTYAPGVVLEQAGAISLDYDRSVSTPTSGGTIMTATSALLPVGTVERTIEAWFQTSYTNGYQSIITYGSSGTGQAIDLAITGSSAITLGMSSDDVSVATPYDIRDGNWHYIAASYYPGGSPTGVWNIYLDGQLLASPAPAQTANTVGQTLAVGGGNPFHGSLDEVAIYPQVLNSIEINDHWRLAVGASCAQVPTGGYAGTIVADHPVEYYRLDESANSLGAADYSGNCFEAAYPPGIQHANGALPSDPFDPAASTTEPGGGPVLSVTAFALPIGSSPRTLEAWFQTSDLMTNQSILTYGGPGAAQAVDLDITGSTTITLAMSSDDIGFATPYDVRDGNWHYVAATYDPTAGPTGVWSLYLDGQLLASQAPPQIANTAAQSLKVGGGNAFHGNLDEVAIYSSALSPARINNHWRIALGASCIPIPTSGYAGTIASDHPLHYYRLDESNNALGAGDSSGGCRVAAYIPGIQHTTGAIIGDTDTAASTTEPGGGPVVNVSGDGLPVGSSARTLEAWFQTSSVGGSQSIITYGSAGTAQAIDLDITGSNAITVGMGFDDVTATTPSNIRDGNWHYVAAAYDPTASPTGTWSIYLDGQLLGAPLSPPQIANTVASCLKVGGGNPFHGKLDEIAIYSTNLTAPQISTHYHASGR